MSRKIQLLDILAGRTCPICGGVKLKQGWSCVPCTRLYRASEEHHELARACEAHIKAADRYISAMLYKKAQG